MITHHYDRRTRRFTPEDIKEIRRMGADRTLTVKDICIKFRASENSISGILKNKFHHDPEFTPRDRSNYKYGPRQKSAQASDNTSIDV